MVKTRRSSAVVFPATGLSVLLMLAPVPAAAQCELSKGTAGDAAANDAFGQAVAVSGVYAVVGAPFHDEPADAAGAAYVFRWDGVLWSQQAKLTASDAEEGDEFGWSVAIDGGYAAIAAPGHEDGAVYVLRRDGDTWIEQARLTSDDGGAGDEFGQRVSISGDRIAIGAPRHDLTDATDRAAGVQNAGAVYVYRRDDNGTPADRDDDIWIQQAKLSAIGPADGDELGSSVSISGDVVLAGAPFRAAGGSGSGAAYVFRYDGSAWSQEGTIAPQGGSPPSYFGGTASVSSDYAAVGAFFNTADVESGPAVYVFERSGSFWMQRAYHEVGKPGALADGVAVCVTIEGDTVLTGAAFDKVGGDPVGTVTILDRSGGAWNVWSTVTASDAGPSDRFGQSVAIGGGYAVVGAPKNDDGGSDSGSAYLLWGATQPDCNGNQVGDFCDIWNGAADVDTNGVPDECEVCPPGGCSDGLFCNGLETCNEAIDRCQPGTPPCSPDQVCDELHDECDECDEHGDCDDGLFCTGIETCGFTGLCQTGNPPCEADEVCDEDNDECDQCDQDAHCDDGLFCNGPESCDPSGTCRDGTPPCSAEQVCDELNDECDACNQDSDCDDGVFCNGPEQCDQTGACQPGTPPCDAGLICDEVNRECDHCDQDSDCDDGLFCTGTETCSPGGSCREGTPPCSPDQACDEANHECDECDDGGDCRDGDACTIDTCIDGVCVHTPADICDDLDQDGVNNEQDHCPGTPHGSVVGADGCACNQLDDDGDGVNNCDDQCAHTRRDQTVDATGCPVAPPPGQPLPPDGDDAQQGSGSDPNAGDDTSPGGDQIDGPPADPLPEDEVTPGAAPSDDAMTGAGTGSGSANSRGSRRGGGTCGLFGTANLILLLAGFALLRSQRHTTI